MAGLAAAVALVERGCAVELFEARRKLGGRAGSFVDSADEAVVDHCQHVAMGCCTNFLHFCQQTGIDGLLERHRTLHFFSHDGRRSDFRPTVWLPAPLHMLPPLLRLGYLSLRDKIGIARAMLRLVNCNATDLSGGPTVLEWLHDQKQSAAAIERFWKVVLVSALSESLDLASLAAARKVFVDGFLAHRDAADILVPSVSLRELYDQRVGNWLQGRGARLHLGCPVASILGDARRASGLLLSDGGERAFDFFIVAVPWTRATKLLSPAMAAEIDPRNEFAPFETAPISSVHLWFDRALTELPHAVLIERLAQWVFARPIQQPGDFYYQVVISASHNLAGRDREDVINEVLGDLAVVFPRFRAARLLRSRLITEHQAVFSVRPGLDAARPTQQTAVKNVLLAGDWTRTGWPATMESAVRSGYLAAEAVLETLGRPEQLIVPDLPRGRLSKYEVRSTKYNT